MDINTDVVIVGTGVAGLFSALNLPAEKKIVMITKSDVESSDSFLAQGGICVQRDEDDYESYFEDTMKAGHYENRKESVDIMIRNSRQVIEDLVGYGVEFEQENGEFLYTREGAHSAPRILFHEDVTGKEITSKLLERVKELENVSILEYTTMTDILEEEGRCAGIVAENEEGIIYLHAKDTILASGGIGGTYKHSTNFAHLTGDALRIAKEHGIRLEHLDYVQIHPTTLYSKKPGRRFLISESVRGEGAVLYNKEGKRFVNELETRDVVSAAILEQTDGQCYLVFDQAVRESLAAIESYIKKGIVAEADTPEALGEKIGVDGAALAETLKAYAGYQAAGKDDEFGRESMELPLDQPKYYAALCAPAIHHTMGGVKINTACEVLKADGSAIPGLFAAGEVTGGVHGANRLGGNAVTDIVVFGRIAGTGAEAYVEANGGHTEAEITADGGEAAVAPEVQGSYKDGVYEGTGKGNNGDITVEVTVEGGQITDLAITSADGEDSAYLSNAEAIIPKIIEAQSADVDTISGATFSSTGIRNAVAQALEEAAK